MADTARIFIAAKETVSVAATAAAKGLGGLASAGRTTLGVMRDLTVVTAGLQRVFHILETAVRAPLQAAAEQGIAIVELANAFRIAGKEIGQNVRTVRSWASELQDATGTSDELILKIAALLVEVGSLEGEGLRKATEAILDYAAATGRDATSAILQFIQGVQDGTISLRALKIELPKTLSESARLNLAIEKLNAIFGGTARALGGSLQGAFTRLKELFGDLLEKIGVAIAQSQTFQAVLGFLRGALEELNKALKDVEEGRLPPFIHQIDEMALKVVAGAKSVITGLFAIAKVVVDVVEFIVVSIDRLPLTFDKLGNFLDKLSVATAGAFGLVKKKDIPILRAFFQERDAALNLRNEGITPLNKAFDAMRKSIDKTATILTTALDQAIERVKTGAKEANVTVPDLIKSVEALGKVAKTAADEVDRLGDKLEAMTARELAAQAIQTRTRLAEMGTETLRLIGFLDGMAEAARRGEISEEGLAAISARVESTLSDLAKEAERMKTALDPKFADELTTEFENFAAAIEIVRSVLAIFSKSAKAGLDTTTKALAEGKEAVKSYERAGEEAAEKLKAAQETYRQKVLETSNAFTGPFQRALVDAASGIRKADFKEWASNVAIDLRRSLAERITRPFFEALFNPIKDVVHEAMTSALTSVASLFGKSVEEALVEALGKKAVTEAAVGLGTSAGKGAVEGAAAKGAEGVIPKGAATQPIQSIGAQIFLIGGVASQTVANIASAIFPVTLLSVIPNIALVAAMNIGVAVNALSIITQANIGVVFALIVAIVAGIIPAIATGGSVGVLLFLFVGVIGAIITLGLVNALVFGFVREIGRVVVAGALNAVLFFVAVIREMKIERATIIGGGFGGILGFQRGGVVKEDTLAFLHAGEEVIPAHEDFGSGRGETTFNVTINAAGGNLEDPAVIRRLSRRLGREVESRLRQ